MLLMDIFPVLLIVIFLYGSKRNKLEPGALNSDYLSISSGKALKGLFAMVVVLHHLSERIASGLLFRLFILVGYLAVAVFFFLSGYGLQKQYLNNENYKNGFLRRRLPGIVLPYMLITLVYWALHAVLGTEYTLGDILLHILAGDPIAKYSWYIISIVVFYVAFKALMHLCKNNHMLMIIGAAIYCSIYALFCKVMGYGLWWYNTAHLLVVGMFWATYENIILTVIKKRYRLISLIVCVLFLLLFLFSGTLSEALNIDALPEKLSVCTALLFVLSVIMFTLKNKLDSPILDYLGEASMEIYLCHGLFIIFLRSEILYIHNDFLYALLAIGGTVVFARLFYHANKRILSKYRKLMPSTAK